MKRFTLAAAMSVAVLVPAVAVAKPPTRAHTKQYAHAYAKARHDFGAKAVGCNLVGAKGSCHAKPTDAEVVKSLAVIERLYAPPVVAVPAAYAPTSYAPTQVTSYAASAPAPVSSSGGLVSCIIRVESSGSPTASNGSHAGLGGWSQTAWQQDGGTRYAPSPTQASYSQQVTVLSNEGSSPQGFGQQTNFEPGHPCG